MSETPTGLPEGPAEDDVYHVWSMRYARALDRRAPQNFLNTGDIHDGPMPVDYNLWILRNTHRTILVDTGFRALVASARKRRLDFDPIDGLARLGLDPSEIETVIITHLHFDHAGNIDRFAKARFHIQDSEVAFATGRCMCDAAMRHPFELEDVVALIRHTYAERVTFHDGDAAPFPGVSLHALPGHSKGLQAVRVHTPRGPVLLASDASHFYANFLRRAPSILTVDVPATFRSYRRLRELAGAADRIVPGHDPRVRLLYKLHSFNGVEVSALHETPSPQDETALARIDNIEIRANNGDVAA